MSLAALIARLLLAEPHLAPRPEPAQVAALRARFVQDGRVRNGRAFGLLAVDTGGCGGCADAVSATAHAPAATSRFGFVTVDDPRAADVLLVTGAAVRNAAGALRRTYDAMPEPGFVIAVGDCAATGSPFGALPAGDAAYALTETGVRAIVPVDLVIRGAPPAADAILLGLLTLRAAATPD